MQFQALPLQQLGTSVESAIPSLAVEPLEELVDLKVRGGNPI
jgi:hypothetical protein